MIAGERPSCDVAAVRAAPETPGCASHARQWVLVGTILGSSLAFMIASIINVALPAIQETYHATVAEMQWVASMYTVFLGALTLTGGAIGDRYGRRRAFQVGVAGLAIASVAGSLAPTARELVLARAAQGLSAALLVPNSLALLAGAFPKKERGAAIGAWSAATSLVGALSPMLGGWFVDTGSWRVAFATIVPVALVTLGLAALRIPDPPVLRRAPPIDWLGAALVTLGLFGVVAGIITLGTYPTSPVALCVGIAAIVAFAAHERRSAAPMLAPSLFASRTFVGVNAMTLLLYLAVTGTFFVLPFNLVQVQGYSSTATGATFLPFAILVGVMSTRIGALADRIGTRPLLIGGPAVTALGLAGFAGPGLDGSYWTTFFAPMLVTGFGMALTVTPLTTTVLGAADASQAGVASGVNNTMARVGTVLAVAVCGVVIVALYGRALERGLGTAGVRAEIAQVVAAERQSLADFVIPDSATPAERATLTSVSRAAFLASFRGVNLLCAALALLGAAIAAATVTERKATSAQDAVVTCTHLDAIADPTPAGARMRRVPQHRATRGCTCGCASRAAASAAATARRTTTRRSTSGRPAIRSSARSSRARTGAGATSTRSSSDRDADYVTGARGAVRQDRAASWIRRRRRSDAPAVSTPSSPA
jgi:EmrB/QacA subfamily drug resistance transporter